MAKNTEFVVLLGLDYPPNRRAEVGDIVSDLPKESISWLLEMGAISPVGESSVPSEPVVESVVETVIEALSDDEPLEMSEDADL